MVRASLILTTAAVTLVVCLGARTSKTNSRQIPHALAVYELGPAAAVSPDRGTGRAVFLASQRGGVTRKGRDSLDPMACFFSAMYAEESVCGTQLIGDGGKSRGPYHIQRGYWQDGCEFGGVDWDYDTLVWSKPHSEQVMRWYWQRYCPKAYANLYFKTLARVHNGGPHGDRKNSTLEYWQRIKTRMGGKVEI